MTVANKFLANFPEKNGEKNGDPENYDGMCLIIDQHTGVTVWLNIPRKEFTPRREYI